MERQKIADSAKKEKRVTKEKTGSLTGERHTETAGKAQEVEGHRERAMDAVREVVQSEGKIEQTERRHKSGADKAMEAVREVVRKE